MYRLVRPAHSALHEGSNSHFLIQLNFNLSEKICSSNQTENLFDILNALFDGSYFDFEVTKATSMKSTQSTSMKSTHREVDEIDFREIDFSIFVRKTGK